MNAAELLQALTEALYFTTFVVTLRRAFQRPRRWTVNAVLFFAALALVILSRWIPALTHITLPPLLGLAAAAPLLALPVLLFRMLRDFQPGHTAAFIGATVGFVLSAALLLALRPLPEPVVLVVSVQFAAFTWYAGYQFLRAWRSTRGVVRQRMLWAGVGALFLGLDILLAGTIRLIPALEPFSSTLTVTTGLLSGVGFVLAFAPPAPVRQLWRASPLLQFLHNLAVMPPQSDERAAITRLESEVALAMGADGAVLALQDGEAGELVVTRRAFMNTLAERQVPGVTVEDQAIRILSGTLGYPRIDGPVLFHDLDRQAPAWAPVARAAGVHTALAAPFRTQGETSGLLLVYSRRRPVFAEDDLELVQVLADQCGAALDAYRLAVAAHQAEAVEHSAQMKVEFLAAAAHDLKSPLTAITLQLQLLQRRKEMTAEAREEVGEVLTQVRVLGDAMQRMLEAARDRTDPNELQREPLDILTLAQAVAESGRVLRPVRVAGQGATDGQFDRARMEQLLHNLIDNAVKFSPAGEPVEVCVRGDGDMLHLTVTDHGMGIDTADVPHIFNRYHRSQGAEDQGVPGMGLGLYICRSIVEAHNGTIWADTEPGRGTTMHVRLPRRSE